MRLSKLASTPQPLGLYVLAAHRMVPSSPIGGEAPRVTYAEKFTPSASTPATSTEAIRKPAGGRPVFITAIEQSFPRPELIDGDHELHAAAADTPYRTMTYRNELVTGRPGLGADRPRRGTGGGCGGTDCLPVTAATAGAAPAAGHRATAVGMTAGHERGHEQLCAE